MGALGADGPVDELILLGDIFETWTTTLEKSIEASRPFFDAMVGLDPAKVIFVPGNHDYHLLVQHREEAHLQAMREGRPPPWKLPLQQTFNRSHLAGLLPEPLRDRLVVTYPNYQRSINGSLFVFHHGHHLATIRGGDMFALGPRFVLERLERLRLQDLSLESLERGSHVFFEITHNLGLSAGARERVVRFWSRLLITWRAVQALRSFLSVSSGHSALASNRGTKLWDVSNFRQPARTYLSLMAEETGEPWQPDVLVFGHSHRQGIAAVSTLLDTRERVQEMFQGDFGQVRTPDVTMGDFHLVNAGCWFREPDKANEEHVDVVAVATAGELVLYQFVDDKLLRLDALDLNH